MIDIQILKLVTFLQTRSANKVYLKRYRFEVFVAIFNLNCTKAEPHVPQSIRGATRQNVLGRLERKTTFVVSAGCHTVVKLGINPHREQSDSYLQ